MQLTPDLLLRAYAIGIFPMAESRIDPELHWIDPDMRGILPLDDFRLPRKLRAKIRPGIFEVRCNSAFQAVIRGCAEPAENRRSEERRVGKERVRTGESRWAARHS